MAEVLKNDILDLEFLIYSWLSFSCGLNELLPALKNMDVRFSIVLPVESSIDNFSIFSIILSVLRRIAQEQHTNQQESPLRVSRFWTFYVWSIGQDCSWSRRRKQEKLEIICITHLRIINKALKVAFTNKNNSKLTLFSKFRNSVCRRKNNNFDFQPIIFSVKMRITQVLCRQHIGFMFKRHWEVQGKRRVQETGAAKDLLAMGQKISDSKEFLVKSKKEKYMNT